MLAQRPRIDPLTEELLVRLLDEEYAKLLAAGDQDVHEDSKATTLPVARAIVRSCVLEPVKAPCYIDLLNINIDNTDLATSTRWLSIGRPTPA